MHSLMALRTKMETTTSTSKKSLSICQNQMSEPNWRHYICKAMNWLVELVIWGWPKGVAVLQEVAEGVLWKGAQSQNAEALTFSCFLWGQWGVMGSVRGGKTWNNNTSYHGNKHTSKTNGKLLLETSRNFTIWPVEENHYSPTSKLFTYHRDNFFTVPLL